MRLGNGGPAFPRPFSWDEAPHSGMVQGDRAQAYEEQAGMSLRDYFAGQALIGILTTSGAPAWSLKEGDSDVLANTCYRIADAMLARRAP